MPDQDAACKGVHGPARCPECGEVALGPRASGGVRYGRLGLAARLIWLVVVLTLAALCVPTVQRAVGLRWAFAANSSVPSLGKGVVTPNPAVRLRDLREGDSAQRAALLGGLEERLGKLGPHLWQGRVRLVGMTPEGQLHVVTRCGLWCAGFERTEFSYFHDITDPDSWDPSAGDLNRDRVGYGPWGYMRQRSLHDGAWRAYTSLEYISVLSVLASCWLLAWVLRGVLVRLGWRWGRGRSVVIVGTLVLVGVYVAASVLWPSRQAYLISTGTVVTSSGWIGYDELMSAIEHAAHNEDGGAALWDAVGALGNGDGGELLLGMQVDYGHTLNMHVWAMDLGPVLEICSGAKTWATDADGLKVELPDRIGRGLGLLVDDRRRLGVGWTGREANWGMEFEPLIWMLLIASMVWFWKLLHWGARLLVARVERRRWGRGECVLCGYPLSPEALGARSVSTRDEELG